MSLAKVGRALIVMCAFLALLWVIQLANWADGYGLDKTFGILPHNDARLWDIVTAPFLHWSWHHLEGNSVPLLVLGFLAAYRGIVRFVAVTAIVIVTSGLAVWLFQPSGALTVGASGLIFGYFGYVVVRGLVDRNFVDAVVSVIAVVAYAYILTVAIPGTPGVSWLGHVGGLAGGVLAGWLLRTRRGRSLPGRGSQPRRDAAPSQGRNTRTMAGGVPGPANPRAQLHKELDDMGL